MSEQEAIETQETTDCYKKPRTKKRRLWPHNRHKSYVSIPMKRNGGQSASNGVSAANIALIDSLTLESNGVTF
jgi:hypothetical protein